MKRKYKVEIEQTEIFVIDVFADNEDDARSKADHEWENGNYQETGDIATGVGTIYDVTNTDDPFHP